MSILIRNAALIDGSTADVLIEENRFARIAPGLPDAADTVIDAAGKLLTPAFYNLHCHAAMTVLRGVADDLELFPWLRDHIWPAEARMTPELAYAGSRLAILEMIRSGVVYFNDMYWYQLQTIRAAEEMGIRAAVGELILFNTGDPRLDNEAIRRRSRCGRIEIMLAPHSVYTTSEEQLRQTAERARAEDRRVHIHLSETASEVADCVKAHGMTPVAWLDHTGVLSERAILAHCVHLEDADIALIRERGATVVHMPASNMKLASGILPYGRITRAGCRLTLGTDGCASNNNLSMFDEMKLASLLAKVSTSSPTAAPAAEIFALATRAGALAAGVDSGVIAEGKIADALLIDLDNPALIGADNPVSHLVYAADAGAVDTVICDGNILMRGRKIPGEAEIVAEAREACRQFYSAR